MHALVRRWSFVLPLLVFASCSCDPAPQPVKELTVGPSDGARVHVQLEPFSFSVIAADGRELLHSLEGGGDAKDPYGAPAAAVDYPKYEAQLIPGWDSYREQPSTWSRPDSATVVSSSENAAELRLTGPDVVETLKITVDGARVRLELTATRPDGSTAHAFDKTSLSFALPADEHFFGMGERFATLDHRGTSLYSWAEEGAIDSGEGQPIGPTNPYPNGPSMTYFPVPFFLSSRGYGVHLDTTFRSTVHFGSERQDALRLSVLSNTQRLTVYVDDNPLATLDRFTEDTGRPVIPSPWAFGTRRRISRGSTVDGVDEWQKMRELHLPITGVDDAVHFLPHGSQIGHEAELTEWVSTLHANGFKALAYYNPYVSASDPTAADDYAYGTSHGFFINGPDGTPSLTWFISGNPQQVAAIDFTAPGAEEWFHTLLSRCRTIGYDGWMHDFGEYVARDATTADGRTGKEVHDLYPVLSAKAAHDFWMKERPDDYFFFVRSGYTGTQSFAPGVWGGDAETSFDEAQGLPSALRSGLNLALSGVAWWGSDVGGFKCTDSAPRDKELYLRWIQLGAVSPIFMDQNHCADPVKGPQTKWTLWSDAETPDLWRPLSALHTRLQPYFQVLAREAHEHGVPVMRHPFLAWPHEPEALKVTDAFFLGPALYASPVVHRGQTEKTGWIPPGRYVDLEDGALYTGGQTVTLPAPVTKLPLLLVEGELLPMLDPSVETLAEATVPGVVTASSVADRLDVKVALGPGRSAQLTLADGTVLRAERPGGTAPMDSAALAEVAPTDAATCQLCFARDTFGSAPRLRISTDTNAASPSLATDGVVVTREGGPARRIRWEVVLLP